MDKRKFLAAGVSIAALTMVASGCTTTTTGASADPADQRREIDAAADASLARLFQEVRDSQQLVDQAQGVLIFPAVVSGGFIVGGGAGRGVLRKGGKSVSYWRMTEGSVGWLAGAQSQAVFILFMTPEALARFEASKGWTAGVDGSISLISVGADARITTQTAQQPITGFALTNAGLMANLSLSGSRFTRLDI
jgi:lipid-binding SYLF domain-containing protein